MDMASLNMEINVDAVCALKLLYTGHFLSMEQFSVLIRMVGDTAESYFFLTVS